MCNVKLPPPKPRMFVELGSFVVTVVVPFVAVWSECDVRLTRFNQYSAERLISG